MPRGTEAIKVVEGALALGFSISEAVQRALGTTLTAFAGERFAVQEVSMCLRNYGGRVYPEIRDALSETLDIPREYLDRLIEEQAAKTATEGAA